MDKFLIRGGQPLKGKIEISGAKNSALPCLAATLLSPETVTLHNVPYVKDLITQRRLLEDLGATVLTPELRTHKVHGREDRSVRSAVRVGQNDARKRACAGAAAGAFWASQGEPTGRLRYRHAADRPASKGL